MCSLKLLQIREKLKEIEWRDEKPAVAKTDVHLSPSLTADKSLRLFSQRFGSYLRGQIAAFFFTRCVFFSPGTR